MQISWRSSIAWPLEKQAADSAQPAPSAAPASRTGSYSVTVTRKAQNGYEDLATYTLIETRYCHEHVYCEDAIYGAAAQEFIFQTGRCDLAGVYR